MVWVLVGLLTGLALRLLVAALSAVLAAVVELEELVFVGITPAPQEEAETHTV